MKPIPFDNVCLRAVVAELAPWVGAKVQRVSQPTPDTLVIEWHRGSASWFLLSTHPVYCRAHLSSRKPGNPVPIPPFCAVLRGRLEGAFLASVTQPHGDRILRLEFQAGEHSLVLIAELLGKHANVILTDAGGTILGAIKVYGPQKSTRPIQVGRPYPVLPPPTDARSPFFKRWIAAGGDEGAAHHIRGDGAFVAPGLGAYPLPVDALGYEALQRDSISVALEQAFEARIASERLEQDRRDLLHQLERVLLAREVALAGLYEARDTARRADSLQRRGEIILAFSADWKGERDWACQDYDGTPLTIRMDPEQTALENAQRFFSKAKKAKVRAPLVAEQIIRLEEDLAALRATIANAADADRRRISQLIDEADRRRWRFAKTVATKKEERPFEGNKIREYLGPGGFTILVGENAAANDYLTLRVAKPDDWWLHVRGSTSAHVIIVTNRKPEKVGKDTFDFAAKLAVKHSGQKHASYVPVDLTQRRYVRRIKGSPLGTVQYTHERTIHVDA